MAVGEFPCMAATNHLRPDTLQEVGRVSQTNLPRFPLAPTTALLFAIDLHLSLQKMGSSRGASEADEVTYYVNRDSAGWVEQRVRRRVYIELKLECTRNRSRDNQKARDDWLCVYCKGSYPSKLRLTDHRVVGCLCGPVDSRGSKLELPVYPNLKTAKQGKDLKLALQRGDGSVWGSLHDNDIWLQLNPELRDVILPPLGARVQVRRFMHPTVENLNASPAHGGHEQPQPKARPHRPPSSMVVHPRQKISWVLRMTRTQNLRRLRAGPKSGHMRTWPGVTCRFVLRGNSTLRRRGTHLSTNRNLQVENDIRRTHHGAQVMQLPMESTNVRLPTPSVLGLYNPAAPPQSGLPFCHLQVPLLCPLLCPMLRRPPLRTMPNAHMIWG